MPNQKPRHHKPSIMLMQLVEDAMVRDPDQVKTHTDDEFDLIWRNVHTLGGEALTLFYCEGTVQLEARAPWGPAGSAMIITCQSLAVGRSFLILMLKSVLGLKSEQPTRGLFPNEEIPEGFPSRPAMAKLPRPPSTYIFKPPQDAAPPPPMLQSDDS